jgi:RNA polymerase sigma-70 factor (ECF subfamily)
MAHVSVNPLMGFSAGKGRVPVLYPANKGDGNADSDEALVARSLKGEEEAFRQLYERYRRPVYAVAYRIIMDPEEAQDATQEIFITVYRSLALWSPRRASFSPWIRKVATNRAIDYWRIRRRRAEIQLTEALEAQLKCAPVCMAVRTAAQNLEQKERAAEVRHFLEGLPRPQRRFIVLHYCDGFKLREIASREGYKLGTVKSTLHRATRMMRRRLKHP